MVFKQFHNKARATFFYKLNRFNSLFSSCNQQKRNLFYFIIIIYKKYKYVCMYLNFRVRVYNLILALKKS